MVKGPYPGAKPKFTADQSIEIRNLYDGGKGTPELSKTFNVSLATIKNAILRAGGKMRYIGRQPGYSRTDENKRFKELSLQQAEKEDLL